jgi:Tfp pilus assembly protein PilX
MQRQTPRSRKPNQHGIVLPMALILLVIISFAGLLAARKSSTFEQFSNNLRTNQVSRVAAEDALRQCERIAKDSVDGGATFPLQVGRIVTAQVPNDSVAAIQAARWNTRANWAPGAANLITITPQFDNSVSTEARLRNNPTCIIQAMVNSRFLVTGRGLSNDAQVAADGTLMTGSEVWLQSILTPEIPTLCNVNGQPGPC